MIAGVTFCLFTRPLSPYAQTYIYSGEGSTDDGASFPCGGNVQIRSVACDDVRTVYKQENAATLDFEGVGLTAEECAKSPIEPCLSAVIPG